MSERVLIIVPHCLGQCRADLPCTTADYGQQPLRRGFHVLETMSAAVVLQHPRPQMQQTSRHASETTPDFGLRLRRLELHPRCRLLRCLFAAVHAALVVRDAPRGRQPAPAQMIKLSAASCVADCTGACVLHHKSTCKTGAVRVVHITSCHHNVEKGAHREMTTGSSGCSSSPAPKDTISNSTSCPDCTRPITCSMHATRSYQLMCARAQHKTHSGISVSQLPVAVATRGARAMPGCQDHAMLDWRNSR